MKSAHTVRDRVLPAALVVFFVLILTALVWRMESPRGADVWGHLFKAEYLARVIRTEGIGAFYTADWMPNWYLGDPFRTYYPPLATQTLTPLVFVFGTDAAYRIFFSLFLVLFSALTYLYLLRTWGAWPACLGTLLAVGASYQLRTAFFEGNIPRVLCLLALPAIAVLTDRLFLPHKRRAPTVFLLGCAWAWAITAHPQQAYIFAVGLALYLVFRLILDPEVPIRLVVPWLLGILLGAMLAAPWLLPAYSHGELPNVPYLPQEKIPLFSASPAGFLPGLDLSDGTILFGIGVILLGLLAVAGRPEPRRVSWFLAGLLTITFSHGPNGVFFSLLPLNGQLLPERFLNFSVFAIPAAASGILPLSRNSRLVRAFLVVALTGIDLIPGFGVLRGIPYPQEQAVLSWSAARRPGRVALMTYPEPNAAEVYFAGQNADLINGWALENTPHHGSLRRVLSAPQWGPEYLEALFSRWNVRTAVVAGDGEDAEAARRSLAGMGFDREEVLGRYETWRLETPSSPVQMLPSENMLVVGSGLAPFLAAFPFAEESTLEEFRDSQSDRLLEYPMVAFYRFASGFANIQSVEEQIGGYLEAGGTAVLDLSGMEDLFGRTLSFLDVHTFRLSFQDPIQIRWTEEGADLAEELGYAGLPEPGWSGATYDGLDVVLATVALDGADFPVFGYKQIGRGKAWFLGANLLYYAMLAQDVPLREYISSRILENGMLAPDPGYPAVPVREYTETAHGITFLYETAEPVEAQVSFTYSPRWEGTIDGIPVPLLAREGLIRITLPAGQHIVQIVNNPYGTIWPMLGLAAALLGFGGGAAAILLEGRRRPPRAPRRTLVELFQKPEDSDGEGEYVPCAHCGFRLAEHRPPTPVTYPFRVSHCPICGAHMDDEGFIPGKDLTREEQARILTDWLRRHGYDPRMVYTVWGFSVEEFFRE